MTKINLADELLDGVEQFISVRNKPPVGKLSLDNAVNVIVRDWLMAQGYLALPDDNEKVVPALAAAEVPED